MCDNMDGPRGHYGKWIKSEKDKYHMSSLICGFLNKPTNPKLTDTEKRSVAARRWAGEWGKRSKLPGVSHGNAMYTVVTLVNNTVLHIWKLLKKNCKKQTSSYKYCFALFLISILEIFSMSVAKICILLISTYSCSLINHSPEGVWLQNFLLL